MNIGQYDLYRADQRCSLKPVWAVPDYKTDEGFIKWFYEVLPIFERVHENRIKRHYNNVLWYSGEYDSNMEYRFLTPGQSLQNMPHYTVPVVINHTYDITEQRVSKLAIYKPNFETVPVHSQEEERLSAENIKTCIESVRQLNNFDMMMTVIDRNCMIYGEAWLRIDWDEKMGEKIDNQPVGDVRYTVRDPYWIMHEPRPWDKVRCIIEIEDVMHVEEVKKRWPAAKDLEPDKINSIWGWSNDNTIEKTDEEVVIYRFMYKPDEFLPNGLDVLLVGRTVLERSDSKKDAPWKYSHGDFPYERITDIDVPGRIFPLSVYNNIIPAQHQYNKMTSMIARAITQLAHAKWFMVKGTTNVSNLGNSHTIVETNPGAPFPQLVAPAPVSGEVFQWHDKMRGEIGTMGAVQGISRGEPPSNSRAASMLKFYEEQEMQRNGCTIDKHNNFIQRVYTKTGSVIQDFYPTNAKRMVKELGEDNRYTVTEMSTIKVGAKFGVIIQNSNGYSESVAGRMEEIGFVMEKLPGIMSPDQAADILGHKQPKKFYDVVTASLRMAEKENSSFSSGRPVDPPEQWQDHLTHRRTHLIFMNTNAFMRMPEALQKEMIDHLTLTEEALYEIAMKNGAMAQMLTSLPDFPRFADPQQIPLPAPPLPPGAPAPGQPPGPGPGRPPDPATVGAQAAGMVNGPSAGAAPPQ